MIQKVVNLTLNNNLVAGHMSPVSDYFTSFDCCKLGMGYPPPPSPWAATGILLSSVADLGSGFLGSVPVSFCRKQTFFPELEPNLVEWFNIIN